MMLWVALHRDQFDEEEQMVVWILYHMTDKAADWALPIIGMIIKGEGNPPTTIQALTAKFKEAFADPDAKRAAARKIAALTQTTTTSEYVTKFRNLMAELDWNTEAYIAQFTRGLHWKVKELLSTKDNIPDNNLEAIFAALVKIDNTCRENKENRPKKLPAKSPATVATSTTTTTQRVAFQKTLIMSHRKKGTADAHLAFVSSAARKGMGSNNVPMDGKPPSRKPPRWEK
ncbi:Retrotransposon gag protein [Rhizoctonia solani]|uniref:Retrotransposon gag protein n=1 Tax=Rhizoctonia solani TaxID=456999 RepID=A0A8H7I3S1_9AGAM|nr:Retrotransposon gag protein [Rhizoctonia solani]